MPLRLTPQPSLFDPDVAAVRNATPQPRSSFYLRRPNYVAWSAEPSVFILETDEPDQAHEIVINRTDRITIVPGEEKYTIALQMVKGANRIEVSTSEQSTVITVAATAIESWFQVLGREVYLSVGRRLTDIEDHFNTPWTTRVSAHLLPYTQLFIPARMPKIQQTRLALMTSMGGRLGHGDGVRQIATAVSYSTPPVTEVHRAEFNEPGKDLLYPYVTTKPTRGAALGRVLDLWYPNHCLAAHQALFQMVLAMGGADVPAPKPLALVSKDDRQILLKYTGGPTEVHFLDPLAPECSDIEFNTSCDAGVRAFGQMESRIDIIMNSPQLGFDEVVESPLNFGFYDEGNFFDASTGSGSPGLGGGDDAHDTVDEMDPYGDGFSGFSLSRRFDAPACLDTRVQRGQRMSKYTAPIVSSSPPALTPEPPLIEGAPLTIDAEIGAPSPLIGNSVFWASSPLTYIHEGDHLRLELPDNELSVVSAWPAFDSTDQIIKSDATTTDQRGTTGVVVVVSPTGRMTVSGLTAMSANSAGRYLTIAGADTADNNGTFPIDTFNSAVSVDIDVSTGPVGTAAAMSAPSTSGAAAVLGATAAGTITVTGLVGMTAESVGRFLTVSGAADPLNNGVFAITAFNSAVSVDVAAAVNLAGAAAVMGAVAANVITVTGLVGMTPAAVGGYLTLSGAVDPDNNGAFEIVGYNSPTSVDITDNGAAPGAEGGLTWSNGLGEAPGGEGGLSWADGDASGAAVITLTGLLSTSLFSVVPASVGRYITISAATTLANNATFPVAFYRNALSVDIVAGAAPGLDASNGALDWVESSAPGMDANNGALSWIETYKNTNVSFSEKIITAPPGFFEARHESMGVRLDGVEKYSIVRVSTDGSQVTVIGNPTALPGVAFITNVYIPVKDRQNNTEPAASVLQGFAGRNTYEVTLSAPLLATRATGDILSLRVAPRVSEGVGAGSPTIRIMTDIQPPLSGDLLYFDSSTAVFVISAFPVGTHHTTGLPIYEVELDGVTPGAYSDNDPLFVIHADACWQNGDPVTPLKLISLAPAAYLAP